MQNLAFDRVYEAKGLTLLKAGNKSGYFGVSLTHPGQPKPYKAQVTRGGEQVYLGYFATAEEAALCIARSPAGGAGGGEAGCSGTAADERRGGSCGGVGRGGGR